MRLFLATITALAVLAGIGIYVLYPAGEFAWLDGPYKEYKNVRGRLNYKAMAIDRDTRKYARAASYPSPEAAMEQALFECRKKARHCELYAVGNTIVIGEQPQSIVNLLEAYWRKHATRIFSSPWQGRAFAGPEIEPALAGMTAYGITRNGLRIRVEWQNKGGLTGEVLNNSSNPARKDHGKWWVRGNQLCRQYSSWYSGQPLCGALKKDGDEYLIYNEISELMVIFKRFGD